MSDAALHLYRVGDRLKQVHMSEVTSPSKHEAMSYTAMQAHLRQKWIASRASIAHTRSSLAPAAKQPHPLA